MVLMSDGSKYPEDKSLVSILTDPRVRPDVVADGVALVDSEVAAKSGVTGMAIKSAYKVMRGIRPGIVASSVESLLPSFAEQLDPFYQEHLSSGESLGKILDRRRNEMANALLAVTDARAEATSQKALRAAYGKVRGMAAKQVAAAAPGIAKLVTKYAP